MTQRKKNIHTHLLETQLLNALRKKMEKRKLRKKKLQTKTNRHSLCIFIIRRNKQKKMLKIAR